MDVFDFRWSVPTGGFQWVESEKGKFLTDGGLRSAFPDGVFQGQLLSVYSPLREEPALFRNFAAMTPNEESILAFANQYGVLGIAEPLAGLKSGERLAGWISHHARLSHAIALWDMVCRRNEKGLAQFFQWDPNAGRWRYSTGEGGQKMTPPAGLEFQEGKVLLPASLQVQRQINAALEEWASPRVVYDLDIGRMVLRIVPKNLLGALWLQLADAVTGNKEYRSCIECGRWFGLSNERRGGTKRKVFCSSACKVRDYRRKKMEPKTTTKRKEKQHGAKTTRKK